VRFLDLAQLEAQALGGDLLLQAPDRIERRFRSDAAGWAVAA
jgi:hypothetical protein